MLRFRLFLAALQWPLVTPLLFYLVCNIFVTLSLDFWPLLVFTLVIRSCLIKKQTVPQATGIQRLWRGLNSRQSTMWLACTCVWVYSPPALLTVALTNTRFLHQDQHVVLHAAPMLPSPLRRLKVQVAATLLWPFKVSVLISMVCGLSYFALAFTIALVLEVHAVCLQSVANTIPMFGDPTTDTMQLLLGGLCAHISTDEFWIAMTFMSQTTTVAVDDAETCWAESIFRHPDILPKYLQGCLSVLQCFIPDASRNDPSPPLALGRLAARGLGDWLRLSLRYDRTGILRRVDALPRTLHMFISIRKGGPAISPFLRREAALSLKMLELNFEGSGLKESWPKQPPGRERLTRLDLRGAD